MKTSTPHFSDTQLATTRRSFYDRGEAISDWAKKHDFQASLVYAVLSGKQKCVRGESHKIAVALGLKKEAE